MPSPSPTATLLPGVASPRVWHRLRALSAGAPPAGPTAGRAHGTVIHAGAQALYARFGDPVTGPVIGIAARDAIQVPVTIRTTLRRLPVATVGDPAEVRDAVLHVAGLAVSVERMLPTAAPVLADPLTADRLLAQALAEHDQDRIDAVRAQLPAEALRALAAGDPAAVPPLLGRGDGLTPVGDDVLAGWLVAGHAVGRAIEPVRTAVRAHAHRTTTLSAALLADAAAGECLPEFRALLLALATGHGVSPAVAALAAIGHTSGAGMLLGAHLALPVPESERSPR